MIAFGRDVDIVITPGVWCWWWWSLSWSSSSSSCCCRRCFSGCCCCLFVGFFVAYVTWHSPGYLCRMMRNILTVTKNNYVFRSIAVEYDMMCRVWKLQSRNGIYTVVYKEHVTEKITEFHISCICFMVESTAMRGNECTALCVVW